jgi:hypothetical protein
MDVPDGGEHKTSSKDGLLHILKQGTASKGVGGGVGWASWWPNETCTPRGDVAYRIRPQSLMTHDRHLKRESLNSNPGPLSRIPLGWILGKAGSPF